MILDIHRGGDPYIKPSCLHSGKRKAPGKDPKNCLPPVTFIGKKEVTFQSDHQVFEYDDDMTEEEKALVWYDESDELENFRINRADFNGDSEASTGSICFNHSRRILLNYQAYKRMNNGSELLRQVSRASSKPTRDKARKKAVSLSKATKTWTKPLVDDNLLGEMIGYNSRIADFYFECMINKLTERNWLCGALLSANE